jgi:rSAM/selenodomain-associated transferase 1
MSVNSSCALLIFAKAPAAGRVKTRLVPPLTYRQAADLYRCMLLDTLAATEKLHNVSRFIFLAGDHADMEGFRLLAPDAQLLLQEGDDLGERLANAFGAMFDAGFRSACVIGTDMPHMPAERIGEAFSLLGSSGVDAVFGPSDDGGYYLLAMNGMHHQLFADVPWSSGQTLAASLARAAAAGLGTSLLPGCFDLDTIEDIRRLASLPAAGQELRTREFIAGCAGLAG